MQLREPKPLKIYGETLWFHMEIEFKNPEDEKNPYWLEVLNKYNVEKATDGNYYYYGHNDKNHKAYLYLVILEIEDNNKEFLKKFSKIIIDNCGEKDDLIAELKQNEVL